MLGNFRRKDFFPAIRRTLDQSDSTSGFSGDAICLSRPNCTGIILLKQIELIARIPDK